MRLDIAADVPAPAAGKTAAGSVSAGDQATLFAANGRGWAVLKRDGEPFLARSHPLTFQGERIGSFEIFIGCGASSDTFPLTYRERRYGPADADLESGIAHIALAVDDQFQALEIASTVAFRYRSLESLAGMALPVRLVRILASDSSASITMETTSISNFRTSIRVGNAGFATSFREFDTACKRSRPVQAEVRAEVPDRRAR
jgi:hypothetical protein